MAPLLLIVAWNRPDLWDLWRRWFAGVEEVQVVLDRRRGPPQEGAQPHAPDWREADRRRQPPIDDELHSTGFALTRP